MKINTFLIGIIFSFIILPNRANAFSVSIDVSPHGLSECSGRFVTHVLDHVTLVDDLPIEMFESNGSGLAINDLNNDGLLDIVLANLDDPETILWNDGNLEFTRQILNIPGSTRAVTIIDADADGWRDIVFTTQRAAPSLWRNLGDSTFDFTGLNGVSHPAYTMNWGDLDYDGDLDLVAASYDAELARIMSNQILFNGGTGVYYYENIGSEFVEIQLAEQAQALALLFTDLNGDARWDIAVGNDFTEPDGYWALSKTGWQQIMPFETITHSTMSFDTADIDNDGTFEFFATDMRPYSDDQTLMEAWQPFLDTMQDVPMLENDPQVMFNTLQIVSGGSYINVSESRGVDASGWSWSGKFGDLDSDGFVDLYVVNGMIAVDLFWYLPNDELIEENQVFRNESGATFIPIAEWGLNVNDSGRGMTMADMDNDGDLDIVVNNLMSASQLFENQLCGGNNLTIDLMQPGFANLDAIGTRLILHTSTGVYQREVRASSGYLSGDSSRIHFGFPEISQIEYLEVFWTDGEIDRIDDINANTHLEITRSD